MIAGIGLDLVEIERVAAAAERHGPSFLGRILHESEDRARLRPPQGAAHLAGLFAAKEAVMKALGRGIFEIPPATIAVLYEPAGKPYVALHGAAADRARALGIAAWHLTITHSRTNAAAVAIALRDA